MYSVRTTICGLVAAFSMLSIANAAPSTLKVAGCNPGIMPFVDMKNGTLRGYDIGKSLNLVRFVLEGNRRK